jgi:hypothetical protein
MLPCLSTLTGYVLRTDVDLFSQRKYRHAVRASAPTVVGERGTIYIRQGPDQKTTRETIFMHCDSCYWTWRLHKIDGEVLSLAQRLGRPHHTSQLDVHST